jgi:hypothetical protein
MLERAHPGRREPAGGPIPQTAMRPIGPVLIWPSPRSSKEAISNKEPGAHPDRDTRCGGKIRNSPTDDKSRSIHDARRVLFRLLGSPSKGLRCGHNATAGRDSPLARR